MTQINQSICVSLLSALVAWTVMPAARVEAQAPDRPAVPARPEQGPDRFRPGNGPSGQQLEHMMAAHRHLEEAGLQELANMVAERAEQLKMRIQRSEEEARRDDERRRIEPQRREGPSPGAEPRVAEGRNMERREAELRLERQNDEFRREVMGAIRELNQAVKQLREQVDELRDRDRDRQ